mgnify:CR=1 FL=1
MTSILKINQLKTVFSFLLVALLFASCSEESHYDFKGQLTNQLEMNWKAGEGARDFIVKQEDIRSGVKQELQAQRDEYPGAKLTSVSVNSIFMISEDITDFSYLDELELYLVAANPTDVAEQPTNTEGVLIGKLDASLTSQSSVQITATSTELLEQLNDSGDYDLYLKGTTNDKMNQIVRDRLADIKITFDIAIEE